MELTTPDPKANSIVADHDARNLAIIYGSLGTLIAFGSLIFAILSWMRSRHQRLAARQTSDDVELSVNTPGDAVQTPRDPQSLDSVSHQYASINKIKRRWFEAHLV
jgi:hypothetical protein